MLPYRLFVLVVAFMCPVFASAMPSPALAKRPKRGNHCTDPIESYSTDRANWMKFHHCIWVNPDNSAELFTYIDDVQYWNPLWYRPSEYFWSVNARWYGKILVSGHGTASGKNVKKHIGKIDPSITPGRHEWYISTFAYMKEGSQQPGGEYKITIDIGSE